MKNPYPNEKFSNALYGLVVGTGSLQERVCDAYMYNLLHVRTEHLPEKIQYRFDELSTKFICEDGVAKSPNQISINDANDIVNEIWYLADVIECDYHKKD
jgi:hypothetical protein